jgi:hypothetical protein
MENHTDFKQWLKENVDTTDHGELYSLHHTVRYLNGIAGFKIKPDIESDSRVRVLTSPVNEYPLAIVSEKMRTGLLNHIQGKYMNGMDADTWFDFQRRLENDN